jgi:hypothetical protein
MVNSKTAKTMKQWRTTIVSLEFVFTSARFHLDVTMKKIFNIFYLSIVNEIEFFAKKSHFISFKKIYSPLYTFSSIPLLIIFVFFANKLLKYSSTVDQ